MEPYSMDLRRRVLWDIDEKMTTQAVASKHRVSRSWVRRLKQRRREHGEIAPRSSGVPSGSKLEPYRDRLHELVDSQPDATLAELAESLPVKVSLPTLSRALGELRLTLKKSRSTPRSRTAPMSRSGGRDGVRR